MIRTLTGAVLALALFAAPGLTLHSNGGDARAAIFNPDVFTLKNGMQVVVVSNHRVPVVTHMVLEPDMGG